MGEGFESRRLHLISRCEPLDPVRARARADETSSLRRSGLQDCGSTPDRLCDLKHFHDVILGGMPADDDRGEADGAAMSAGERLKPSMGVGVPVSRRVLRLTLTEPVVVPMSEDEHQQAVAALSSMISAWLQRRARGARAEDQRDLGSA
jgi:hypothetical protein